MIYEHNLTPSRTEWEYKRLPDKTKKIVESNPKVWDIIRHAAIIGKTVKEVIQMHSCFQILGHENKGLVPLTKGNYPPLHLMSQIRYDAADKYGIFQLTFFKLSALDVIKDCCILVKNRYGFDIDIEDIPLDDPDTYRIFCNGEIEGIFQFDSYCVKEKLSKFQPKNFNDLVVLNSLYTLHSMDLIPAYLQNKESGVEYANEVEREILSETHGVILYREQMIEIIHRLSGLSRKIAWRIVFSIDKWNLDELHDGGLVFFEKASENGYKDEYIQKIWLRLRNRWHSESKSHKTCYTLIAYRCAWLKAHYPKEYEESFNKY